MISITFSKRRFIDLAKGVSFVVPGSLLPKRTLTFLFPKGAVAPTHVDRRGYHLTLDKIPAWVYTQCGEVYFDEPEVEAIEEALRALDQKTEQIAESA